jgi:hypothetical protein
MKTTVEMAKEAGFTDGELSFMITMFEHFEALVRAAEREACAKVCESKAETMAITGKSCDPDDLAAAIRARGNT